MPGNLPVGWAPQSPGNAFIPFPVWARSRLSTFTKPYHMWNGFPNHSPIRAECQFQRSGFALTSRCHKIRTNRATLSGARPTVPEEVPYTTYASNLGTWKWEINSGLGLKQHCAPKNCLQDNKKADMTSTRWWLQDWMLKLLFKISITLWTFLHH